MVYTDTAYTILKKIRMTLSKLCLLHIISGFEYWFDKYSQKT